MKQSFQSMDRENKKNYLSGAVQIGLCGPISSNVRNKNRFKQAGETGLSDTGVYTSLTKFKINNFS